MLKMSKKILAVSSIAAMLLSSPVSTVVQAETPAGAKYKPVQLSAVRTKEISYYKIGDTAIPASLNWVTDKTALDFIPTTIVGDVNSVVKDADNVYWIGTQNGLQRVDFTEKDARDIVQYMTGPRYLYGGDDNVLSLAADGAGGIWVKNKLGVTHIAMPKRTMKQKADFYEKLNQTVNDRRGMVASAPFTFTDSGKSYVDYNSPSGSFVGRPATSDNDGLWTAMYALGEIYRYNTLKTEYGENPTNAQKEEIVAARDAATRATKAVLLLSYVSGRDNGFPARSYNLTSEAAAATTGGTDYGYQSQNGFWFHSIVDGSTNPNGIIPSMQRKDKQPIGYSIVRVTNDAMTKIGDQLYASGDPSDPMSYNGVQLSQAAINELNKTRPDGQKLGTDIYILDEDGNKHVMPVITQASVNDPNHTAKNDSTINENNKPVFQLTVPIYAKIPKIFNDLFPARAIAADGYVDQNQIVYKADTSSDEVDGHYAVFFAAYTVLCDDSTPELKALKPMIAEITHKMTNLILKDKNYFIEDATGKGTQWSRWTSKYFNDNIGEMEKQPEWSSNVGIYDTKDEALSYGYEDGPLNALEVMATLKTAMTVTSKDYPMDQKMYQDAYNLTFDSSYSKEEPYVNGKGYMGMALEYIKRREVRQATHAFNILKELATYENVLDLYNASIDDWQARSHINSTIHNDWTQYINYSDEELGWFPIYQLILQEKNPVRYKQIVDSYIQWYENEKREENPFYTFLYQLAKPTDNSVSMQQDIQSSVRFLYRTQHVKIGFPVSYDRQDVFYIEPGDRDGAKAQTNYALPLDEQRIHRNNSNPFARVSNSAKDYSPNANFNYNTGGGRNMDDGVTFLLPYWFGRSFGIIKEVN
ncbi:hypothetical protein [Neobacillus sp. CF12]|uniref:hypothetical protein n=1 Tax=Neobacillus sp. CF12 TaxID=3055864 RepID=UPI0025A2E4AD|nr:hypothetical protein [Neobacillus sp. CF12]MDM5330699.1 hypothetical protein [Neobacillus sp. CF12]